MPKKDFGSLSGMLGDILREVSWPFRVCIVLGVAAALALLLWSPLPGLVVTTDGAIVLWVVVLVAGIVVGCGLGAVAELAWSAFKKKRAKPPPRERPSKWRPGRL
jgi:hypothetical protein